MIFVLFVLGATQNFHNSASSNYLILATLNTGLRYEPKLTWLNKGS
jgi:hypothetical protein